MNDNKAMLERLDNQSREFPTLEPRPGELFIHVEDACSFAAVEVSRAIETLAKPGEWSAELQTAERMIRLDGGRSRWLGVKQMCSLADELDRLRASLAIVEQEKRSLLSEAERKDAALRAIADVGCNEHITFEDRKAGRDCVTAGFDPALGICDACRAKAALSPAAPEAISGRQADKHA